MVLASNCRQATISILFPVEVWESTIPPGFRLRANDPAGRLVNFDLVAQACQGINEGAGWLNETWGFVPVEAPNGEAQNASHYFAAGGMVESPYLITQYERIGLHEISIQGISRLSLVPSATGMAVDAFAQNGNESFHTQGEVGASRQQPTKSHQVLWFGADREVLGKNDVVSEIASIRTGTLGVTSYEGPLTNAPPSMVGTLTVTEIPYLEATFAKQIATSGRVRSGPLP